MITKIIFIFKHSYSFLLFLFILSSIICCEHTASVNYKAYGTSSGQALIKAIKISEPLTFCGEQVPLQESGIRERLERELLICLDNSDDIIIWIKRANRYFPFVEKILNENSMPDDLKYIAIAESALRPHARSNKGAVGHWQFLESTATKYGLIVNNDIDERRNFFLSTQAAVNYLKDLFNLFGSWTLAAAAYNMGEEGLKTEMLIQEVSNYYQLYLYQETQRYIFRILAIKLILSNPARYGYVLTKDELYNAVEFDQVQISTNQPIPLNIIAQAADTYFKNIKDLNPQFRHYYLPEGTFTLHIPKGKAMGFSQRYENLLSEWLKEKSEQIYTVQSGDNLTIIAERFNVSVKALMIWNGLTSATISPGEKLVIFSEKLFDSENYNNDYNHSTQN